MVQTSSSASQRTIKDEKSKLKKNCFRRKWVFSRKYKEKKVEMLPVVFKVEWIPYTMLRNMVELNKKKNKFRERM